MARFCDVSPLAICAKMAAGDSSRGLSLVNTTWFAYRWATAAIKGRFDASRLPPQPKTHHSCPCRCAAQGNKARNAFSSASGVWA